MCVVQSVSVCANELLKKKKAHSLLEAMLRLKQLKREGGKYPQMSGIVQGITWEEAMPCKGAREVFAWASELGFNQPANLH